MEQVVASSHTEATKDGSSDIDGDLQALFRQHFESRFKPLNGLPFPRLKRQNADEESSEDQSESDWEGLSDKGDGKQIEIVEHTTFTGVGRVEVPREELKTFMV